tara:strand:- start:129 stop:635 length:507 start_codon:yes stop_codon:yes gene_type:complete
MLKSKILNFFLISTLVASNAFANSYLRPEFLKVIKYGCLVEEKAVVFCTDQDISDPHLIIRLPLLEPIVLSNGVHAFRVMATLENNTGYNLSGARVRVLFGEKVGQVLDVLISEKIIYRATSTTKKSYLIRSDVPILIPLYERLNEIYLNADISEVKISLNELIFEET